MISYLRGELVAVLHDKAIIDVGGVGYGVFMSERSMRMLPGIGEKIKIHTYMNVKEDAMHLFGFLSRDDLEVFKLVIGVNGIGPKGGLNILAELSPDELRFAVAAHDIKAISTAPGIGKKTAEKLILELRDKLKLTDALPDCENPGAYAASAGEGAHLSEAAEALAALGYGHTEALRAVRSVTGTEKLTTEEILKQALKQLAF